MTDPKSAIDLIMQAEEPIHLTKPPLMEGDLGRMMRKIERERKQAERDASVKENYTFCRKRCKLFKKCACYSKTFAEQKECADSGKYLELAKKQIEDVTNVEIKK